ncbi:MAG: response regulator [Alistipes sp.]|nr:response regulator [Alistipes sp.]
MAAIKILSVDDEAPLELLMRQYFRRKIRNGEYEFFFAHNGLEALSILYNNPDIEIILSDINMPEMDGLTLLAKVNEMRNPALRVIMVSAYGDMKNIREAMNNGAFDFATKPIDMDDPRCQPRDHRRGLRPQQPELCPAGGGVDGQGKRHERWR